jgi:transposase
MSYNYGMAKRKYKITAKQEQELVKEYQQSKDGPLRTRCQAVRMYGQGYGVQEIRALTGCSRTSLMEWCQLFLAQGVAGLRDKRLGGNRAKLSPMQLEVLKARLIQYTPGQLFGPQAATPDGQFWTVEDLHRAVQQWYEVSYRGRNSYTELFARCDFSYQRPAKIYKSRNQEKVAEFEELVEKKSAG